MLLKDYTPEKGKEVVLLWFDRVFNVNNLKCKSKSKIPNNFLYKEVMEICDYEDLVEVWIR